VLGVNYVVKREIIDVRVFYSGLVLAFFILLRHKITAMTEEAREPNGYLHIGHASSICLNFGLGLRYNAPVNLRFDDTNPAKEEQEFVDAIKRDVEWLGYTWDTERYASDYFQQLYDWAVLLIKDGKAYVDTQSSAEMAEQKGTPTKDGVESPFRNRAIEENLQLFEAMKAGKYGEGTHVLRAKIDMTSSKPCIENYTIGS